MRDIEGKYLSEDVVLALRTYLLERGCKVTATIDNQTFETIIYGVPNIISVHLKGGFYSLEFTEPGKSDIGYVEVPEDWVKSFIRDKKINQIID